MSFLVQKMGYLCLGVKDPDGIAEDISTIMGVHVIERGDKRILMSSNKRRAELVLQRAPDNGLGWIGLEATNAAAIDEVRKRALDAGLRIVSEKPLLEFIEKAVSLQLSTGHIIEVHTPIPSDMPIRHSGPGVHPTRLDHVNLTSTDVEKTSRELQKILGMRLSEYSKDLIYFHRAANGYHHTVAVMSASSSGLQHYSWELSNFSDFKRLGDALDVTNGRNLLWGPGRHGAGDNLFAYYFDSAGFMGEGSGEMEVIHDLDEPPRECSFEEMKNGNRWCAIPPPEGWITHSSPNVKLI